MVILKGRKHTYKTVCEKVETERQRWKEEEKRVCVSQRNRGTGPQRSCETRPRYKEDKQEDMILKHQENFC